MGNVVVRFAPSPTGYLHIGGARTAIFNWLFARKHGGRFILRIEDTDTERSTADSIQGILDGLRWLGLEWDVGPNFQSQFTADHLAAAESLLQSGHAYKCFCTKEMLEAKKVEALGRKTTYRYDGACRELSVRQVAEKEAAGEPFIVRLKVPREDGAIVFHDAVCGTVEKRYQDIEDFVLVRANGRPLYVLANAVDDIRDGITHIIRGQDGLANTPKQILIYQSLGAPLPVFAHMSLTLDPRKTKISKRRHGQQVAIQYYKEQGFLPWAMVNFLALLGWATPGSRELFSTDELIEAFGLEGISRTNSIFNITPDDPKFLTDPKLISINAHYLRSLPLAELLPHVKAQLRSSGLWDPAFEAEQRQWFGEIVDLIRPRYHRLTDFATLGRPYFSDVFPVEPTAAEKYLLEEGHVPGWFPALADRLAGLSPYDKSNLEAMLGAFIRERGIKAGKMMNAVRVAVTGQSVGPEFLQVLLGLGRERVAQRLRNCAVPSMLTSGC
jgi:glutamyl-tRNA synthetase